MTITYVSFCAISGQIISLLRFFYNCTAKYVRYNPQSSMLSTFPDVYINAIIKINLIILLYSRLIFPNYTSPIVRYCGEMRLNLRKDFFHGIDRPSVSIYYKRLLDYTYIMYIYTHNYMYKNYLHLKD